MSTLVVSNVHFDSSGFTRIEYTGNDTIRARGNSFIIPSGNTMMRPAAEAGSFRYNTQTGYLEIYSSITNNWQGVVGEDQLVSEVANQTGGLANSAAARANSWANTLAIAGNSYTVQVGAASNTYAEAVGTSGNNYTNAVGVAGNNYTNAVGSAGNNYTNAVGVAGNNYAIQVGAAANNWANTKVDYVVGTAGEIFVTNSDDYNPTINLISTGVVAAAYGSATQIPTFVVDALGRLTYAANVTVQGMDYPYTNAVGVSANSYADSVGVAGNNYTNAVGSAGNNYTNAVGVAGNNYTNAVGATSNTYAESVGTAGNNYTNAVGASANNYANNTFFLKVGGDVSGSVNVAGDFSITGNLRVTGNTSFISVQNYEVDDPLIYLAANNYTSDIVDIGFIANYVNTGGANVHTGLYREHTDKEYYLFQGYDKEPINNHIGALSNNMTLSVLNADLRTSNLNLGGANAILWITDAYNKANAANVLAYDTGIGANAWSNTKVSSVTGTTGQIFSSGGTTPTLNLVNTSVVSSTYGGSTQIPVLTVDGQGRLTYAANVAVSGMDYPYANAVGVSANSYADATFATKASPTFTGTINMASANLTSQTLTDAASISWDISQGTIATVTLGGNRTLSNPTNLKVGTFILHVVQDGSGNRTLGYGSAFKFPAGVAPVLTTTASARDVLSFVCDGTNLYGSFLPDVK